MARAKRFRSEIRKLAATFAVDSDVYRRCQRLSSELKNHQLIIASNNLPPAIINAAIYRSQIVMQQMEQNLNQGWRSMTPRHAFHKVLKLTYMLTQHARHRISLESPSDRAFHDVKNDHPFRLAWVAGFQEGLGETSLSEKVSDELIETLEKTLGLRKKPRVTESEYSRKFVDLQIGREPIFDYLRVNLQRLHLDYVNWDSTKKAFHITNRKVWAVLNRSYTLHPESMRPYFYSAEPYLETRSESGSEAEHDGSMSRAGGTQDGDVESFDGDTMMGGSVEEEENEDHSHGSIAALDDVEIPESVYDDSEAIDAGQDAISATQTHGTLVHRSANIDEQLPSAETAMNWVDLVEQHIDEQLGECT